MLVRFPSGPLVHRHRLIVRRRVEQGELNRIDQRSQVLTGRSDIRLADMIDQVVQFLPARTGVDLSHGVLFKFYASSDRVTTGPRQPIAPAR